MMVGDKTLPIENAAGVPLLQLQCAAEHYHKEGQCLMTIFLVVVLNKEIELQQALHIGRILYCFRHFYVLTTHSELTITM